MTQAVTKQVCKCENCGNEAEMEITCTLPEAAPDKLKPTAQPKKTSKIKGTATCANCGNEADMWIDYPQS
ncbi:MAG: hypothetical protein WA151_16020 [Desulfatirhabdiaceae bacterium]